MAATKIQRFVDLHDHVKHLSIQEILNVAVMSVYAHKSVGVPPEDTVGLKEPYASYEEKLKQAILNQTVQPLDPQTMHPLGSWSNESLVTREQFTKFFATIGIEVRKMLEFTTSARPLCVEPALLELDANARIRVTDNIGECNGAGSYSAGEYRAEIEACIKRQAEGFFTVDEAAQVLADSQPGVTVKGMILQLRSAFDNERLPIRNNGDRLPVLSGQSASDFMNVVKVSDIDAWLASLGVDYRFPQAVPAESKAQGEADEKTDGLTKREKQIRAIEAEITTLKYSPLEIPDGGKPKIQAACKKNYVALFGAGNDPFKEAWQCGVGAQRFRMANHHKYAKK